MNAALKSKIPSGADEFELPEKLSPAAEILKTEQQMIKEEIAEAKSRPVVRKQDESTRLFDLRKHQMELKLQELEEKKKLTEKELQEITQKKNSTLHTDLRKLAQFLLQETRKVSSKIDSVSNMKNELQLIFESNISDRKKALSSIEDQNKALAEIGDLIRDTSKVLQGEFHFLTKDIERIQKEKEAEQAKLSGLKEEVAKQMGIHEFIEKRKVELRELEEKISVSEKNALSFARLDEELLTLKAEIQKHQGEKENLRRETQRLEESYFAAQENLKRMKLQETELEHSTLAKKNQLILLESDIHETRKRVESAKDLEHEVISRYHHERDQLALLQTEISRMEASKATHLLMASDSQSFYEERKVFYQRELDLVMASNESRKAELLSQNEARKHQWDLEFQAYTEARKSELKADLEKQNRKDLEDIRNKKTLLLDTVGRTMTEILNSEGFKSSEERTRKAKKEVESVFEHIFGKTRRWKIW